MKNSRFFTLCLVGILNLILCCSAEAAAVGTITNISDQIKSSSLLFYSNISSMALSLLVVLFGVSFAWKTISLVLKQADFQEIVVALIKAMIALGVYVMFIKNGDAWLKTIVDGSQMMAAQGAGISSDMLNPGAIMSLGIDLQDGMVKNFNAATGADSFLGAISNFFPAMMIMVACLMVLFAFAMIAFNLFLTYAEMYLIIAVAPFMFALGGTEWTRENSMKPFQSAIAVSVKILVLALIAKIAIESAPSWANQLAAWKIDDWRPMWMVAFQILSVGILALLAPKLASAILAGGTSMSAGDAIHAGGNIGGMATGAGAIALGAAAAGAGGVGKAAQALGGAGAEVGGAGKALKAGFDQNRTSGMGFGESAWKAPVPGLKSGASMAGIKMDEVGKNLTEGGKGMVGKVGDAISNSVGGQIAEKIKGGASADANSQVAGKESSSSSSDLDSAVRSQVNGPKEYAAMMDKLARMKDFVPPDGMISGASVTHIQND